MPSSIAAPEASWPPLRGYRLAGVGLLAGALAGFISGLIAELFGPETPATRAIFWAGVALLAAGFVGLPMLLLRVLHLRGLERLERRLWMMRAVWGGPFGALGALWDLSGSRRVRAL